MFMAESYVGHKLAWPGDLVINSLWAWARGLGFAREHGIVSSAYGVYRPRPQYSAMWRYLDLLLRSKAYDWELHVRSKGVWTSRLQLTDASFLAIPILLPSGEDADQIVGFSDHVERRINRLIRAKRQLIELLNEQRQVIIHRAVTRGLDPNVRLKPSGVDWLGEVPDEWDVVSLGHLIDITTGFPFASEGFSTEASDVRLLRGINISPGAVHWDAVVRWAFDKAKEYRRYELNAGDIVLGLDRPIIGSGIRAAVVSHSDTPSLLLQRVARMRPNCRLDSRYLFLLITGRTFREYMTPIFTGISVPHLSPEQIKRFSIALPSLDDQSRIVSSVTQATSSTVTAIDRARREIDLLREYRTRLITDVVTGKLDVRGVELPLLDGYGAIDEIGDPDDDDADELLEAEEDGDGAD